MLIGVHVLIAAHIVHWKLAGTTITPVEPSEAMQTLELGYVNAGFVLFALLILSTLVLGRFFCGWGCHVVALQDLCGWFLRKIGIRPKPFRSRLLVFVPLLAAFYMFAWPTVLRMASGGEAPRWVAHFTTDDFWSPFPTVGIAILTFAVCGFLIVALLGNKGFCTYGCPYGGIFYYADAVAPGKIRVTDACDGCGHCTTACTSNVRVHEEVREHGMVVDSGCMKCMDCVDVCPKGALYWGFGKPGVASRRPERKKREYDLSWGEEFFAAGSFVFALYALRGLYEAVPFLLALGLSAICAYLLLSGLRLFTSPNTRLQRWQLRSQGKRTAAGWAYAGFVVCLVVFLGYASFVMFHVRQGEAAYQSGQSGPSVEELTASLEHYRRVISLSPVLVEKWEARLGALLLFSGEAEQAATHLERAVSVNHADSELRFSYGRALALAGRDEEAIRELTRVVEETDPALPTYPMRIYGLNDALVAAGRGGDSAALMLRLVETHRTPGNLLSASAQLRAAGRLEEAFDLAEEARRARPLDFQLLALWALLARETGKVDELLQEGIRAPAEDVAKWYANAFLYRARGDDETARALFSRLKRLAPEIDTPY